MATRLWQHLNRLRLSDDWVHPDDRRRWIAFYIRRKSWRVGNSWHHNKHMLNADVEKRSVRYIIRDDPVNGGWDKVGVDGNNFYYLRKNWKHLSNFTQARLLKEWRR